jgi:hypothetical protein
MQKGVATLMLSPILADSRLGGAIVQAWLQTTTEIINGGLDNDVTPV